MINLSTPSDELWRVLLDEHDKAIYWMKKHFGGEKRYEQMRDDLLRRCERARKPLASEVVDYKSKGGNRWVCFEQATYYPESLGAFCLPLAFCYYETIGSIGVFSIGYLHINGEDKADSIFIYTPHFFQRFAERMNIQGKSRDLLMRFIEMSPSFTTGPVTPDEDGNMKMDIRIPGCVCRGVMRKDKKNIYEIRTILNDKQLTKKQLRDTKEVREIGDVIKFEPDDLLQARLLKNQDAIQAWHDEVAKLESHGIDMSSTREAFRLNWIITESFIKMGIADKGDKEFWMKYSLQHKNLIYSFITRKEEEPEHYDYFQELVKLAKDIATRMGVKKFNQGLFERIAKIEIEQYRQPL